METVVCPSSSTYSACIECRLPWKHKGKLRDAWRTDHSFFGGSAAYAWTVLVIAGLILVSEEPVNVATDKEAGNAVTVGTTILFKPLLSALIYLWARDNPTSKVTLFGLVNVPARGGHLRRQI